MAKEKQEKWQSLGGRLARLRLKIILGVVFSAFFVFVIAWIASRSFASIIASVETLSSTRTETGLVNEMIADISEIQAYSGQYSISKNTEAFDNYQQKTVQVRILIDSLKNESGSKKYGDKLDTLRLVFDEYVTALDEWLLLRAQDSDNPEYKIYGLIRSGDSSLKHTSQFLPKAEVTKITQTVSQPQLPKETPAEPKNTKSRIRRSKKTGNTESAPAPRDSVSRETTTQITTFVDSSYLYKVDTLLSQMKVSLNKAKSYRSDRRRKMSEREGELMQTELLLMNRIRTLLSDIEREEALLTKMGIDLARRAAEKSYRQLIVLGIIGLCSLIILGITLFSDVSKSLFYRKKLQEAKQEAERLARVKEEFLANMSHEIRTPINSIIGFTEQLQSIDMHPRKKAKVHAIWRSSNHLLALINDILDFSKLEAGSLQLEQIGFCYTEVIEEVIEMTETEARRKGIQIVFEPNEASETMVTGDPVRIKQILLNLVGNAVKFTEKGSVSIQTKKKTEGQHIWITCRVKDSGKGIQPAELDKIFLKFEQADSSITRHHGGTGLGLSISKKLAELQDGQIWAESQPGKGSVFSFEIPFLPAGQNDYRNEGDSVEYVPGSLDGKKIAVVDDDPVVAELLQPLLDDLNMESVFFHQPEKAWEVFKNERFDLIFVDLHMPDIDGMEMLDRLHRDPANPNKMTATVLCTANVVKNVRENKGEKIPDYVLYKPYKRKDVVDTIFTALGIPVSKKIVRMEPSDHPGPERPFTLKNFREFAGNDLQLLENFIVLFISESENELARLNTYLQEQNFRQIGETAHLFKNTFGQLEAVRALAIINRLEVLAKEKSISDDEIGELIKALQLCAQELFSQLRDEIRLQKETDA